MIPCPWCPDTQLFTALMGGSIFAGMGLYVILLWADQRRTEIGRSRIRMGLHFVLCGLLIGLGGLYVLVPAVTLLVAYFSYLVVAAILSLKDPLPESEVVPVRHD